MNKILPSLALVLCILIRSNALFAQSLETETKKPLRGYQRLEAGIFLGASNYEGDLAKTTLFNVKEGKLGFGGILRYHFTDRFAVRGNVLIGTLSGNDANYADRKTRGYSFTSPLFELTGQLEWEPLGDRRFRDQQMGNFRRIISPYLFAGAGFASVKPKTKYGNPTTTGNPTEIAADQAAKKPTATLALPFGAGLKYDLNRSWMIGLEGGFRVPFTDYLDGVSISGNKDEKDWYIFGGLTATYRFWGKSDKDNDGIPDSIDDCPETPGGLEMRGCPTDIIIDITPAEKAALEAAIYGVQFETGKSTLLTTSYPILDKIVELMMKHPAYGLKIKGHTDNSGDDALNQKLSEARATACFNYLSEKGVSAARMTAQGYGETSPVADNGTPEGRTKNRRVEFELTAN
jgi:outer membrane protein OmpA-like peptidoglycan-associated protein/opacity protein-like surface antigen